VTTPWILFGAFDRHNVGDLLLPHVAAALLPGRPLALAGLAERDLRALGGYRVQALSALAAGRGETPATVLHVGGEVLTCSAWAAAAMLLPPGEAPATIAYLEQHPDEQRAWVRRVLGTDAPAPYAAARAFFRTPPRTGYLGVGGAGLDHVPAPLRDDVLSHLRAARVVTVRDGVTLAHLQAAGVPATLLPDPAVMTAELFGPRIRERGARGEMARVRRAFPAGYLAVQCSAEFGDDATLAALAAQLQAVQRRTGLGLALFRAGAAPWHDDLPTLRRLAARLSAPAATVFETLELWDVCALIAASRGYAGSSLHGRIVATAFALPRINVRSPAAGPGPGKHEAYVQAWEDDGLPGVVEVPQVADAIARSLAIAPALLASQATRLAAAFRRGFSAVVAGLDAPG